MKTTAFEITDWITPKTPDWIRNLIPYITKWSVNGAYRDVGGAQAFGAMEIGNSKFRPRWMHTIFPPDPQVIHEKLSSDPVLIKGMGISEATAQKEFYVPIKYREFGHFSNGAFLFAGHLLLDGWRSNVTKLASSGNFEPTELHQSNYERRLPNTPADVVVLGIYTYSANLIFGDGEQIHVSQDLNSRPTATWQDFEHFITDEFLRIDRLFTENGVLSQPNLVQPTKNMTAENRDQRDQRHQRQ